MTYLLDTNVCIEYLNTPGSSVGPRLRKTPRGEVCICSVVQAELLYGACRTSSPESSLALVREFLEQFNTVPFDRDAAEVYGPMRAALSAKGAMIGPYDLMIAAVALSHGLTLVTHNTREFTRVQSLRLEDWQSDVSEDGR